MQTIRIAGSNKFPQKGQALMELAIFGSVLLFCLAMLVQYGMEANYQQQVEMEAFRKAQKMAFNRSGPNAATSLVLIKDKGIPDPRDQFGYAERNPTVSGQNVVWDTEQQAQYVKKFTDNPKPEDLPAVFFEIDWANRNTVITSGEKIGDVAKAPVPAGENNAFGFYTARFEKRSYASLPDEIFVVTEDPTHKNPKNKSGSEYFALKINKADIWVGRIEGMGFGEGEIKTDPDYVLLMYPYYRDSSSSSILKRRITDADLDGDGEMENIIGADKDKQLFYIRYKNSYAVSHLPGSPTVVGGDLQVDATYSQIEAGDKVKVWDSAKAEFVLGGYLSPEQRQGMIKDFEKTTKHAASKIEKTKDASGITSKTTLAATQRIMHKFRLNSGKIVSIPVEISTNPNPPLYDWSK